MLVKTITQRLEDGLHHIAMVEATPEEASEEHFIENVAIQSEYPPRRYNIERREIKQISRGRYVVSWKTGF